MSGDFVTRDGGTRFPLTCLPLGPQGLADALREAAIRDPNLHPTTDRERVAAIRDLLRGRRDRSVRP